LLLAVWDRAQLVAWSKRPKTAQTLAMRSRIVLLDSASAFENMPRIPDHAQAAVKIALRNVAIFGPEVRIAGGEFLPPRYNGNREKRARLPGSFYSGKAGQGTSRKPFRIFDDKQLTHYE
jgi:hypothetical protein